MIFSDYTHLMRVRLAGAHTTTAPTITGDFRVELLKDKTLVEEVPIHTVTNGTTNITVLDDCDDLGSGYRRVLLNLSIYNDDTVAATVIVEKYDGTNARIITRVTLAVDDTLHYEDGRGWYVLDINGNLKVTTGGSVSALDDLTDVTITAANSGDYIRHNGSAWVDVAVSQLLTDIKTVDGSGSGLDADTVDGVEASALVQEVDYDANTILAANSDNTPLALTIAEQRLVGRITGGNIAALTAAQVRTLLDQKVIDVLWPTGYEPPSSNYATLDTRNSHPVLDFDGSPDEEAVWKVFMPSWYGGGGLTVLIEVSFTSATSGTSRWQVAIERQDRSGLDIDADSFASFQSAGATAPGTSGQTVQCTVTLTDGAQIDSVAAGEYFRLKLRRDADGTSGTDDITTDAEVHSVVVKET